MRIGCLEELNQEKIAKGTEVGVSAQSLLDDIEYYLCMGQYNPAAALQAIQKDLLVTVGKLKVKKE